MILVVDPENSLNDSIRETLGRTDTLQVPDLAEARASLGDKGTAIEVAFLGPGLPIDGMVELSTWIRTTTPETSVVVVSPVMTAEMLRRVLRAGVTDVLPASFSPKQLEASFDHARSAAARERERSGGSASSNGKHGSIITLLSAKGGVGKSFIASNLAILLASEGASVALVDLDLEFGDVGVFLQLAPRHTISEAAQYPEGLDEVALEGYLTAHRSGVRLLAAPQEPGLAETVSAEDVKEILNLLAARYSYVIVDTPATFTDHVLAAIDSSDLMPAVTAMDVPSIRSASMCLRTLEMLGVASEKIPLILNRADSRVGLNLSEVEKALGSKVAASIPSSREVPMSVNSGRPLAETDKRSTVTRSLVKLLDHLRPAGQNGEQTNHRILGRTR